MKYSILVQTWNETNELWKNYEWNASVIAARVYSILRKRFDLKDEKLFKLINPDETNSEKIQKTMYSPIGATKLDEKGWAKFGLYLVLEIAENAWPKNPYKFISYIKILDDKVLLKTTEDSKAISLNMDFSEVDENLIENEYDNFLNHIIKDSFKNWLNS